MISFGSLLEITNQFQNNYTVGILKILWMNQNLSHTFFSLQKISSKKHDFWLILLLPSTRHLSFMDLVIFWFFNFQFGSRFQECWEIFRTLISSLVRVKISNTYHVSKPGKVAIIFVGFMFIFANFLFSY